VCLCAVGTAALVDHLVGLGKERRWDFEAERLGGFQVDDQFVFRRCLEPAGRPASRLLGCGRHSYQPLMPPWSIQWNARRGKCGSASTDR
jgi:hypothetical protein